MIKFKGLRTSIAFDFAALLGLGMLLLNFVILALWQQSAVRQSIDYAKTHLILLSAMGEADCGRLSASIFSGDKHFDGIRGEVIFFRNGTIVPEGRSVEGVFETAVRNAGYTNSLILQSVGREWSIFGISSKNIIVAQPISGCSGHAAVGIMMEQKTIRESILRKQSYILVYILVNIIILTTVGFFRMRQLVISPLENLAELAESYRGDSDGLLILSSKKTEFGHIATALHGMLSQIENDKEKLNATIHSLGQANKQILANQNTLVEAEKFAALGRLSAGLAHEIGNPLGIIQGYVELMERSDLDSRERRQYSKRALKELGRISDLIQQLLELTRKKSKSESSASICKVINELVEMLHHQKGTDGIRFTVECDEFVGKAFCSEADMHQVFLNCILNSIDAISEHNAGKGEITITCSREEDKNQKFAEIRIADNGGGIRASDISSVFDAFFTTKEVGQGTGLGLSVSRTLVENCGGSIRAENIDRNGTRVIIRFPTEEGS